METCLICGRLFVNKRALSYHITVIEKITYKEYYDLFLKTETDGKCKVCGNETKFSGKTYNKYCSRKCIPQDPEIIKRRNEKSKETCLEKYGVEFNSQSTEHREKVKDWWNNPDNKTKISDRNNNIKTTSLERYNVDNPAKYIQTRNKISNTKQNFSDEKNKLINEKRRKSCLERYGVDNPSKIQEIITKIKETKMERYGKLSFFTNISYSKISQEFFDLLVDLNKDILIDYQYATHGKEYTLHKETGNLCYYDFTCHNLKKIIEYNGECFHPSNDLCDDEIGWHVKQPNKTAGSARKSEQEKYKLAIKNGFEILTIWNSHNLDESLINATNFLKNNEK